MVVESLKGLVKMTAWLEVCGRGEATLSAKVSWGSWAGCRGPGCECGRRGFACAMSAPMGP